MLGSGARRRRVRVCDGLFGVAANENGTGRVVLAGAPLGNVGDASARLREGLVHVLMNHHDFVTIR